MSRITDRHCELCHRRIRTVSVAEGLICRQCERDELARLRESHGRLLTELRHIAEGVRLAREVGDDGAIDGAFMTGWCDASMPKANAAIESAKDTK